MYLCARQKTIMAHHYTLFLLHLSIVLGSILLGMRMRGIGLGVMSALGLLILFFLGVAPQEPSFKVMQIMISALTAAAALEAAGTLDLLAHWASKTLHHHPRYLVWLSPLITYLLVFCIGTSHIIYPLLPVIAAIAQQSGIRPEKPLVASVIASQQALMASPLSAATTITLSHLQVHDTTLTYFFLLRLFIPATLLGTLAATWATTWGKKDLYYCLLTPQKSKKSDFKAQPHAVTSLVIFLIGVVGFIIANQLHTTSSPAHLMSMTMLSVAACIAGLIGTEKMRHTQIFTIGLQALVTILGVTWLARSFLTHHESLLSHWAKTYFHHPWQWGCLLFVITIISNSQGTTLETMIPWALTSLTPIALLLVLPAANSFYVLPSYPTILAAVALDKTKSTRIGRFVINHSFILPGIVGTLTTCLAMQALAKICL